MTLVNIYTYAFFDAPVVTLELPVGIFNHVQVIQHGEIFALVEPNIDIKSLEDDDQRLIQAALAHDRVICELFRYTNVLPLQFGTTFSAKESLINYLDSHGQEHLNKLQQLQGKAEYCIKFIPRLPDEADIASKAKGKQYFLAKKQQYESQKKFKDSQKSEWDNIVKLINKHYLSVVIKQMEEGKQVYILIDRQQKALVTDRVLGWQQTCPGWELQIGEALPPYHFI